jgi:chromosome segregation ATPase
MKKILNEELENETLRSETLRTTISKLNKDCGRFKMRKTELETLIRETEAQIKNLLDEKKNFEEKYSIIQVNQIMKFIDTNKNKH